MSAPVIAEAGELESVATTGTWDLGYVEYNVTFLGYAPNHLQAWLIEVIVLFIDDDGTLQAADVADDEVRVADRSAARTAARELADFLVTWSV